LFLLWLHALPLELEATIPVSSLTQYPTILEGLCVPLTSVQFWKMSPCPLEHLSKEPQHSIQSIKPKYGIDPDIESKEGIKMFIVEMTYFSDHTRQAIQSESIYLILK
jgi:hypothetical protein